MNESTTDIKAEAAALESQPSPQKVALRIVARLISVLFHPLLMPTYMLALLIIVNPYLFGISSLGDRLSVLLLLRIFLSTFFIPMVAISMLRTTGLVSSFSMRDSKERIGPYIITGIFYLWMFRNFYGGSQIPTAYTSFMLGATIALFLAFFINIFSRISIHTVGMGTLLGMVIVTMLFFSYDTFTFGNWNLTMNTVLVIAVLLAGLVGTARQVLYEYSPTDLYGGYLVGFLSQVIALRFIF